MRRRAGTSAWFLVPAALVAAAPAGATQYLKVEDAQKLAFAQADAFTPFAYAPSAEQRAAIDKAAHARATAGDPMVWRVIAGGQLAGWFIVDNVIGKVERITYAVALSPDGTVRSIEILDYRETHGYEVRNAAWRRQFDGKSARASLEFGSDIKNISGATLSCRHLTDGVRRLLAIHDMVLK
jgi:Na+-translocating ferredoxin:NAD+ oxidoreductase RnfG subunit